MWLKHLFVKLLYHRMKNKFISNLTRGIWNVLSMVFYLSNQFANPIMFDISLKSYLTSMLCHKFREDIMQTRMVSYMYCWYTGKCIISVENITFYLLKSVQNINNSS